MSVLVEVFVNDRAVRANVVAFDQVAGWVEIEDLTALQTAPSVEISDPEAASAEKVEDLVTPTVTLPTKKLYGTVKNVMKK